MMLRKSIYFLSLMLLTTACGGRSDTGDNGAGPSYKQMLTSTEAMVQRGLWEDFTRFDMLPASGTASFSGISALYRHDSNESKPDLMSQASLTANFDQSTIRGNLTNFRDRANNSISGSVGIDGRIYRDYDGDVGFEADLNGSLATNGHRNTVSGTADGYFYGDRGHLVDASLDLTIGDEQYLGVLGAER